MASTKKPAKESSRTKTADDSTKLDRLRELVAILEGSTNLGSLEYEDADIVVKLSRGVAAPTPMVAQMPAPLPAAALAAPTAVPAPVADGAAEPEGEVINSPFVGTFYRAASPNSKAFTDVGQKVAPKQVLCIIEAMKLMNEIECEFSGTVAEIYPDNGQAVQYGDPLFRIVVDK